MQQAAGPSTSTTLVETMWNKNENGLESITKQMKSITKNKIMTQALSPL
jgi:hypothetical protein